MMNQFAYMNNYYLIGLIFLILMGILVSNDATRRGNNGGFWAMMVILIPIMGMIFYLMYIALQDNLEKEYRHKENYRTKTTSLNPTNLSKMESQTSHFCINCGIKMN